MKIDNLAAGLILAHLLVFAGLASGNDFKLDSLREVPSDIQVPAAQAPEGVDHQPASPENPAPVKEWTVMIFMNGSNNLAPYFYSDINALARIGSTADVNVALEFSLMTGETSVASRVSLLPTENGLPKADVYNEWKNHDMGDWRNAADFVRWAKASFPAKRYMLIIQNHGGGFVDQTYTPKPANKGISYDEVTNNYIKIPELARLLKETGPVDMLVLNACEMQLAEVAYELGPDAGVILASEDLDNAKYFQYKERLGYLAAAPQETTEKIAAAFVELRRKMLTPGNQFYSDVVHATFTITSQNANTLSALRAGELAGLPAALDAWTSQVMASGDADAVRFAVAAAVRFGVQKPSDQPFSQFTDLRYFARSVAYASKDQRVKAATDELMAFLKKAVIANSAMNQNQDGVEYGKTIGGLGIKMIPLSPVPNTVMALNHNVVTDTKYADLNLSKDSRWDEFLAWAGQLYYRPR